MDIKKQCTRSHRPTGFRQQDTKHEMKKSLSTLLFFSLMGLMGLKGQYKDFGDLGGLRGDGPGMGQEAHGRDSVPRGSSHGSQVDPGGETLSWGILGPAMGILGGVS
jgi:hypothetical protein